MIGGYGLQAVIDDNNSIYVVDETPSNERRYRARFYFDPNTISMRNGNAFYIFAGYTSASTEMLRVEFRYYSGSYQLRTGLIRDNSSWVNSNWQSISDAPHYVELDWRAATAAGANNGHLTLWIDGTQRANMGSIDNDTMRIDFVRFGAVAGLDNGTRGTCYFDAFESRRLTYIGP